MHVERAFSNLAILIVGSMTAMVGFVSTRLNHIYFYVLAGACIVLALIVTASAFRRLARRFPVLLGKVIAPRWEMARRKAKPVAILAEPQDVEVQKWQPSYPSSSENHATAA
jgi:hypothetical protein